MAFWCQSLYTVMIKLAILEVTYMRHYFLKPRICWASYSPSVHNVFYTVFWLKKKCWCYCIFCNSIYLSKYFPGEIVLNEVFGTKVQLYACWKITSRVYSMLKYVERSRKTQLILKDFSIWFQSPSYLNSNYWLIVYLFYPSILQIRLSPRRQRMGGRRIRRDR